MPGVACCVVWNGMVAWRLTWLTVECGIGDIASVDRGVKGVRQAGNVFANLYDASM